jgi:hypothetical protein
MNHLDYFEEFNLIVEAEEIKQQVEETLKEIDNLADELENKGKKLNSAQTGLNVLDKLLDKEFEVEELENQELKEDYHFLLREEVEAVSIDAVIHGIENLELYKNLADKYGHKWLPKALGWVKKILDLPFKLIQKFAAVLARKCGASFEVSEITGLIALGSLALVGIVYGIAHFPAVAAIVTGGFSILALLKLISALVKGASGFYTLFKKWFKISKEVGDKKMTINDLLDIFDIDYKKKYSKRIPFNFKSDLYEWSHDEKNKEDYINTLAQKIKRLKSRKKIKWIQSGIKDLKIKIQKDIEDTKVKSILNNLLDTYL